MLPLVQSTEIIEIPTVSKVRLFLKREDMVHPEISGNKYWKLFFNINNYLKNQAQPKKLITFGGAFSNHIAAVAAAGKISQTETLGIIRGEELQNNWQQNPTLYAAAQNGMAFRFVKRSSYRDKSHLTLQLEQEFPNACIIPEGGTNADAVEGIQYMLGTKTECFDYLCTATGTGGTAAGLSKFAKKNQLIIGFPVVNDLSLKQTILNLSAKNNFELINAANGGYGKISDENIRFINEFYEKHRIPLDPIYTGKMMQQLFKLIEENYFPDHAKILAFHTGGLQGIAGANKMLKMQNRTLINFEV